MNRVKPAQPGESEVCKSVIFLKSKSSKIKTQLYRATLRWQLNK